MELYGSSRLKVKMTYRHPYRLILTKGAVILTLLCTFTYYYQSQRTVSNNIFDIRNQLSQNDPIILEYLVKNHVFPPTNKKRNFGSGGFSTPPVFLNKSNGFFIECGANDGMYLSNTIGLEIVKNWTGLLIEGSPALFNKLRSRNRNAWLADVCLSGDHPEQIEFLKHKATFPEWRVGNGKINPGDKYQKPAQWGSETFKREDYESEGLVDCVPLYSLLSAINVTHVDYFSLDVEGHEFKILKAIPYERLQIDVIQVEHWLAPEGKDAIKDLLVSKGYLLVGETESDYIFSKPVE